jgi:serine/threonine-protein kinase
MPLILVGRYLPQKLLGQGGFGAAFLAIDRYTPTLRRCVAKQFQPSGDLSPAQMELAQDLFNREAETLEQIGSKHREIPDLYAFFPLVVDRFQQPGQQKLFYLVQEFIDGQDLEAELEQKGQLSEAEVREILVATLKTLQFVHNSGVIHRDIKPSNIMRHQDGRLYLLDFGAVKRVTTQAAPAAKNQSTGIYSMGFAPPEQMSGGAVYPATDLYALAVTCITLLTGKQPKDLYDSYSNGWHWQTHAQVSDRMAAVLDRMLLPSPSQRFPSAEDALAALNQPTTSGASASASATSMPPRSQPSSPPNPAGASSTSLQSAQPPQPATPPIQPATPAPITPQSARSPAASASTPSAPAGRASGGASGGTGSFSLLEFLGSAAFTGFEAGLFAIALFSLSFLGTLLSSAFWLVLLAALVLLQYRRVIERVDLLIIAAVTLLLVLFVPPLQSLAIVQASPSPRVLILILAVMAGLFTVAIAIVFRLIYKLLSSIL